MTLWISLDWICSLFDKQTFLLKTVFVNFVVFIDILEEAKGATPAEKATIL